MIRRKRLVYVIAGILVFFVLTLSIAFAALSTTLNITMNKVTQQAMSWNIGFQTGTITGVASGNNTNSIECGTATATATSISTFNTTLSQAGDMCAYTFKLLNNGTVPGKISAINITKPTTWSGTCSISGSTMTCGNFVFKLRYDSATSNSLVAVNNTIAGKTGSSAVQKTLVLTVEYTGDSYESEDYELGTYKYQLSFVQG